MKYYSYIKLILIILVFSACKNQKNYQNSNLLVSASERGKVVLLSPDGKLINEYGATNCYDSWKLKNGDILFTDHYGVKVIDKNGVLKLHYKTKSEVFSCQPLENDRILIGECSAGRLVEINMKGEIEKTIPLKYNHGGHSTMRGSRKLSNGNYLVAHYGDKTIREYSSQGVVINEFVMPHNVYEAIRLKNGNTLISDRWCVYEVDNSGKHIWSFDTRKYPDLGVYHLSGINEMPNGDFVICNWLGHKPYKKGVPIFSINKNKEIVWKFNNSKATYSVGSVKFY